MRQTTKKYVTVVKDGKEYIQSANGRRQSLEARAKSLKQRQDWAKKNTRRFILTVHRKTHANVITHLEKQQNLNAYLISLVQKDMK